MPGLATRRWAAGPSISFPAPSGPPLPAPSLAHTTPGAAAASGANGAAPTGGGARAATAHFGVAPESDAGAVNRAPGGGSGSGSGGAGAGAGGRPSGSASSQDPLLQRPCPIWRVPEGADGASAAPDPDSLPDPSPNRLGRPPWVLPGGGVPLMFGGAGAPAGGAVTFQLPQSLADALGEPSLAHPAPLRD
jgi:hypothetical protein